MRHLCFAIVLLISSCLFGQSYGSAIGLRLGNNADYRTMGLTGQYRLARFVTLEGIVQTDFRRNTTFHLLVERHRRILTKRLNLYTGVGFSAGWEQSTFIDNSNRQLITSFGNETIGIDLLAGVEITLLKTNISIDYKPNINLVGREPWYIGQVGISARQVLASGREQSKRQRQRSKAKRKRKREKEREDEEPWLRDWYDKTFKKD